MISESTTITFALANNLADLRDGFDLFRVFIPREFFGFTGSLTVSSDVGGLGLDFKIFLRSSLRNEEDRGLTSRIFVDLIGDNDFLIISSSSSGVTTAGLNGGARARLGFFTLSCVRFADDIAIL